MPVRVNRDGQIVERVSGYADIGASGRKVSLGSSEVMTLGTVLNDDQIADYLLEMVKNGECPGLTYLSEENADEPVPGVAKPAPAAGSAQGPDQVHDLYDPDENNQASVLEYLKDASPEEVARVKQAEARGQNRQQIASFKGSE
jgi:hypothetical protein